MNSSDRSPTTLWPRTPRDGMWHDVIIVGGQAAGLATAMLLARRALRILLLDHGPPSPDTFPTYALMRGAVHQLSRWGVLDGIISAGTPPLKRTTLRYGDDKVVMTVKPSNGVDALYAPGRAVLDPVLLRAALEAGVDVRYDVSVTDVLMREGRVVGVRVETVSGRSVDLEARLVIGADGIQSTMARRVDATFSRVGEHPIAITYAYWSDVDVDGYEWVFRPNLRFGVIPTNDRQACVFVSGPPQVTGTGGVELIRDVVDRHAPDLAERLAKSSVPTSSWTCRGHVGYIRRSVGPGWALVGEAGYYKDPTSAHGFADAMRDADLLARAVVEGFDDISSLDEALENYQSARDRLGIPLFDVVDRIASQRWDDAEVEQLLLQLSSAMADEVEGLATLEQEAA